MKSLLHSNRTVEEIGEEFNNSFPYLKIVFVSKMKLRKVEYKWN
ncbi:MAG: hypothetical protein ACXVLT_02535 [Flavisolibacter sp.]